MSLWMIGADDVSEETQAFRDKLASKDAQIVAQQEKLSRQAKEFDEMKQSLNEALHKLNDETTRALKLEKDVLQRTEELRNEKIATQNIQTALAQAQSQTKTSSLDMRELQATLEAISQTSDEHKAQASRLEREKTMLEHRVRELEVTLRDTPPPTTTAPEVASRHRSSSLSNFRITTLEQDLVETRSLLSKKDEELQTLQQRFSQVQQDLIAAGNENVATERRLQTRVAELESAKEEKEEELSYLREQLGDGSREEELMRRIEEDSARIEALEVMLKSENSQDQRELVRKAEARAKDLEQQLQEREQLCAELNREKEALLDDIEDLQLKWQERETRDQSLAARARKSLSGLVPDDSSFFTQPQPNVDDIERLLEAVERLRGERDELKMHLTFIEQESRFSIEALETQLSHSTSSSDKTEATIRSLKEGMDQMRSHLDDTNVQNAALLQSKNARIFRLGRNIEALSCVVAYQEEASSNSVLDAQDLLERLEDAHEALTDIVSQRDYLQDALDRHRADADAEMKGFDQDAYEDLEMHATELERQLSDLESERDSLALHVNNLTRDLEAAQSELGDAENRYTTLHLHQLNTMSSNEATRTLKDHIAELEGRVQRRNEQIGIHQHDIKRLETNLKLQEDRLSEMNMELETMAGQKDAMVEDCADAREARNSALQRVEALEEELESLSESMEALELETEQTIVTLISVIGETASNARSSIRSVSQKASARAMGHQMVQADLSATQQQLAVALEQLHTHQQEVREATVALALSQIGARKTSEAVHSLEQEKTSLASSMVVVQCDGHESTIADLQRDNQLLQGQLRDQTKMAVAPEDQQSSLEELRSQHAEAMQGLQTRLEEAKNTLEEHQIRSASAVKDHESALAEANESIAELRRQLEKAGESEEVEAGGRTQEEDALARDTEKKIAQLEDDLSKSSQTLDCLQKERDALQEEKDRLVEDMARIEQEHAALLTRSLDEHYAAQREMEKRLSSLQKSLDEQGRLVEISKEEAGRLSDRLEDEINARTQEQEQHMVDFKGLEDEYHELEDELLSVKSNRDAWQEQVEDLQQQLRAEEEQRDGLQREITSVEAELQKTKSLQNYLEGQLKESETTIANLKTEVEKSKIDQANAEKAWKTAELNLSLVNVENKRQVTDLQKELKAYESRGHIETALAQLEERNNEMEELLRAKCAEIEENDDRALEMAKEKKKLAAKVETLTRKVQNLQAKLGAAKAQAGVPPNAPDSPLPVLKAPKEVATSPIPPQAASVTKPAPSTTQFLRTRTSVSSPLAAPVAVDGPSAPRRSSSRLAPQALAASRPKTPPQDPTPPPVPKSKSPERPALAEVSTDAPPPVIIGKKRAAPDDFSTYSSMPAQAFNADGQDIDHKTPRMRKVLHSLHSGFTPNRNHARSTTSVASPRRSPRRTAPPRTTAIVSETLENPLGSSTGAGKNGKKSWLGKIRGNGTGQTENRSIFPS